jgi:hypothetical protein
MGGNMVVYNIAGGEDHMRTGHERKIIFFGIPGVNLTTSSKR